jgi:hypothetical protein
MGMAGKSLSSREIMTSETSGSIFTFIYFNFQIKIAPMQIGFGQHDVFKGQIKEVRVYNRVLKQEEIELLAKINVQTH